MNQLTESKFENDVLTVKRLYNAPRADVFDAWMSAEKMNQWYGPDGTREVKSDIVAKVGGIYNHEMIFEGGKSHKSEATITEYDPPVLFAYSSPGQNPGETMEIRVEFIEQGNATLVLLTHGVSENMAKFVTPAWTAAFEKLATFLQSS